MCPLCACTAIGDPGVVCMGNRLSLSFDKVDFDGQDEQPREWLTAYSKQDLERYFKRFLQERLMRGHGFSDDFVLQLDTSDPFVHALTVSHKALLDRAGVNDRNSFLIKMFVRRDDLPVAALLDGSYRRVINAHFEAFQAAFGDAAAHEPRPTIDQPDEPVRISTIEYLYSQNPLAQWSGKHRAPLPSQMYPSLGVGLPMLEMIVSAATEHQRDALSNRPEHFHNALLYQRVGFTFVSPEFQAYFEVMLVRCAHACMYGPSFTLSRKTVKKGGSGAAARARLRGCDARDPRGPAGGVRDWRYSAMGRVRPDVSRVAAHVALRSRRTLSSLR